jgi:hemolysin III
VNSITHGLGVLFGVVATVFLVLFAAGRGDAGLVVGCAVFGASVILLYLASTLYHSIQSERWKLRLQRFDHVAIYLLIAGTYTPFALGPMRGAFGITLLCVVWALALAGSLRKLFGGPGRDLVSVALYLGMGWMAVIAFPMLDERLPAAALGWLIGGGSAYTLGTAFFLWQRLPFAHSIWHVFVLGGTVSHAVAILFFVHPALAGAA